MIRFVLIGLAAGAAVIQLDDSTKSQKTQIPLIEPITSIFIEYAGSVAKHAINVETNCNTSPVGLEYIPNTGGAKGSYKSNWCEWLAAIQNPATTEYTSHVLFTPNGRQSHVQLIAPPETVVDIKTLLIDINPIVHHTDMSTGLVDVTKAAEEAPTDAVRNATRVLQERDNQVCKLFESTFQSDLLSHLAVRPTLQNIWMTKDDGISTTEPLDATQLAIRYRQIDLHTASSDDVGIISYPVEAVFAISPRRGEFAALRLPSFNKLTASLQRRRRLESGNSGNIAVLITLATAEGTPFLFTATQSAMALNIFDLKYSQGGSITFLAHTSDKEAVGLPPELKGAYQISIMNQNIPVHILLAFFGDTAKGPIQLRNISTKAIWLGPKDEKPFPDMPEDYVIGSRVLKILIAFVTWAVASIVLLIVVGLLFYFLEPENLFESLRKVPVLWRSLAWQRFLIWAEGSRRPETGPPETAANSGLVEADTTTSSTTEYQMTLLASNKDPFIVD